MAYYLRHAPAVHDGLSAEHAEQSEKKRKATAPIKPPKKIMRRSGVRKMISPPRASSAGYGGCCGGPSRIATPHCRSGY